jgi:hypothetical protein
MFRLLFISLLALAGVAIAVGSGASAQGPATRTLTFKELERGATFAHIRNTKARSRRANNTGDVIVFTNPLADASGARVGKLSVSCTTTSGARNFMRSTMTCVGVIALRDGTLTAHANVSPSESTSTAAVTGGTGAYAGARGVYVSTQERGGSTSTITLSG